MQQIIQNLEVESVVLILRKSTCNTFECCRRLRTNSCRHYWIIFNRPTIESNLVNRSANEEVLRNLQTGAVAIQSNLICFTRVSTYV